MTVELCVVCGRPLDWHEKKESWGGWGKPVPIPCTPPASPDVEQQEGEWANVFEGIVFLIGLIILFAILGWAWRL